MGNSANQLFKDDEQERQTGRPSDDQLRHITGISPSDEAGMEDRARSDSAAEPGEALDRQEKNPDGGFFHSEQPENKQADKFADKQELKGDEQNINAPGGSTDSKSNTEGGIRRFISERKRGIAGIGIATVLGGGGLFGIGMSGATLQMVYLAKTLAHSFSKNNEDTSSRSNSMFRDAKALKYKNIGYTRVGIVGTKIFKPALAQLEDMGVTFKTNIMNRPTKVVVDKTKFQEKFPEAKNMTPEEFKGFLSGKLQVDGGLISGQGTRASPYEVDASQFSLKELKTLTGNTVGLLDGGDKVAGLKTRELGKFFGLGSIFHPFSRAWASKVNKLLNAKLAAGESRGQAQEEAAQEAEGQLLEEETAPIAAKADTAEQKVRDRSNNLFAKMQGYVLTGAAIVCVIRDTAGEIVTINHDRVALPAAIHALNVMAMGSQIMAGGQGISLAQVGASVALLTDSSGKSVWGSAPLNALNGQQNPKYSDGVPQGDLANEDQQAFSESTTAEHVKEDASNVLGGDTSAAFICSPAVTLGLIAGFIVKDIVAVIAAPETGGGSLAVAAAIEIGIHHVESLAVTAGIFKLVDHFVLHPIVDSNTVHQLGAKAFAGINGGGLLAYGSREAANLSAIASGGTDLGNHNTTIVFNQELQQENEHFRSESMFARMFDAKDQRTLAGHFFKSVSPSFTGNLNSAANGITNIAATLGSLFSSLLPRAHADSGTPSYSGDYLWSFSQYGLPASMLNDPNLENPYDNADKVVDLLNAQCTNSDGSLNSDCSYIKKVATCFGDTITHDNGIWDVIPDHEINSQDASYTSAGCNDFSDYNWKRVDMFVEDSTTAKGILCYTGADDSQCNDFGAGNGSSSTSGTPTPASGSAADIATVLLKEWGGNLTGNPGVKQDLTATSQGKTINNSDTCGKTVSVDAALLQVILTATSKYKLFLDNIITGHGCDQFLHPKGRASDIGGATDLSTHQSTNFTPGSSGDSQQLDHDFYVYIASIMPKGSELGQDECAGRTGIKAPPGITFFSDSCTHQHIDLGNP